jgi:hypothetical protein
MCSRAHANHQDGARVTRGHFLAFLLALALVGAGAAPASADDRGKNIFGFVEWVAISEHGFNVKARLDTGARTSSLDARNIRRFRRGDTRYVRFDVENPDTGELLTLERELVRIVRIRRHDGPPVERPVVKMWVCIGDLMQRVEVNLTARTDFLYPLLIGRSAMRGKIIVDPDLSLTVRPDCDLAEFDK